MSQDGKHLFTSESVTDGHPDKICDQISDAILDDLLRQDPESRVACETMATTGLVLIAGEITTQGYCDFQKIVRDTVREIGYTKAEYGFDYETCCVLSSHPRAVARHRPGRQRNRGPRAGRRRPGARCSATPAARPRS